MFKPAKKILLFLAIFVIVSFLLFMFNQVLQVSQFAAGFNPHFGQFLFVFLLIFLSGLMLVPVIMYIRLPARLTPPKTEQELQNYRQKLEQRLLRNKIIRENNLNPSKEEDFAKSLELLEDKANEIIDRNSTAVFFTTAISQNGKLDAFSVFVIQTKMIWDIAHVFYQRPSLKDLMNLYGNVGATVFFVSEIEELDISQQIEPVVRTLMRRQGGGIPIVGAAANIIVDSVVEGAANSFLTFRIGIIARRYCSGREVFVRRKVKKAALIESSERLTKLVWKSTGKLIGVVITASKKAGTDTVKSGFKAVQKMSGQVKTQWDDFLVKFKAPNPKNEPE